MKYKYKNKDWLKILDDDILEKMYKSFGDETMDNEIIKIIRKRKIKKIIKLK